MLADPKYVKTDLVGVLDPLDQLAHSAHLACGASGVVEPGGETIDSDFHGRAGSQ